MAHHKSAEKRTRSDAVKNTRNRAYMSSVRTAVKKLRSAVNAEQRDDNAVGVLFKDAQSKLARAAKRGIIHKNNASRKVSRLAHMIKLKQGEVK